MIFDSAKNIISKIKVRWTLLFVSICFILAIALFFLSLSYFRSEEVQRAQNRASLYRSTLLGELERFQHLPFILAQDPFVIAGARGENREGLNKRLKEFALRANLDAIYLMDVNGLTVAASNYDAKKTFLGQNYGFRPYFKNALLGRRGEFFGIGATTSLPGYFIAERVNDENGEALGVIAIKLDLSDLAKAWKEGGENVFVANSDGVIVLSSNEDWRYRTLAPISEQRRKEIEAERQFANEALTPLDWENLEANIVQLNSKKYIYAKSPVSRLGWSLYFLADERRVLERSWFTVIGLAIIASILLTLAVFLRSERIRQALNASQKDREQLRKINKKLAQEIEERRAAERRLEKAQSELARNSKLAALGQLSASVTHELGQPIAALQNYLAAAELDTNKKERSESIKNMRGIVSRMVNITKQLRFFAKPGDNIMEIIDLRDVFEGVDILVAPDIKAANIKLKLNKSEDPIWIKANRLRLEQILVNLIRNSIAAMQDCSCREIEVIFESDSKYGIMSVRDSGHGLGQNSIEQLKEPFHTTRASGDGMGLGLAISAAIVKEHEGIFSAENIEGGGAIFIVKIPLERTVFDAATNK